MSQPSAPCIVADIGGTNSRVALCREGRLCPGSTRRYRNADHTDFEAILDTYLTETDAPAPAQACIALAGPVRDGAGEMTNLDWTLTESRLSTAIGGRPVTLLNDLQAQGHALGRIVADSMHPLLTGAKPAPGAAQLVIGVGTGFNAAAVHEAPCGRLVLASECGHAGLPVRDEAEFALSRHLAADHGFAAVEDVLSGGGLERLDRWLGAGEGGGPARGSREIMQAIAAGEPRARHTGRVFAGLFGAMAGDLALIHLPFGGIWLVGGMARAFAPYLMDFGFAEAFHDKGRFAPFMESFAVTVIEDDYAALTGCAAYLRQRCGDLGAPA